MVQLIISIQPILCPLRRKIIPSSHSAKSNLSSDHFIEYVLQRKDVNGPWKEHTEHEFVRQMADGTLPVENFKVYLVQDYLFLVSIAL
jgi:hypothetical protein